MGCCLFSQTFPAPPAKPTVVCRAGKNSLSKCLTYSALISAYSLHKAAWCRVGGWTVGANRERLPSREEGKQARLNGSDHQKTLW